jgi:hypothetical protein
MKYMKSIMTMAFMLLFAMGAWADPTVDIIKLLNGAAAGNTSPGTVTYNISESVCTLTVVPVDGNYVTSEFITVYSTVTGEMANGRAKSPNLDTDRITVTPVDPTADPSGTTSYTFPMPEDGSNAEVTVDFQSRKNLTDEMVTLSSTSFTYNGGEQMPDITVKDGSNTLTEDVDYSVEMDGGTEVSNDYIVIVNGIGIYKGEVTKNYAIVEKELTSAMVADIASQIYTGMGIEPEVTVTDDDNLTQNEDFEVVYTNNINAGQATATITGIGNYSGSVEKNFTINPKSIATATVSADATQTYTYTGSAITPNVTVTIILTEGAASATALTAGTDYTITGYANNINAATADSENAPTITITGTGNFTGTATGKFTIAKADFANVTIGTIDDQLFAGNEIKPAVTVTFNDEDLSTDEYEISYSNNTNVGTATVTLTSKGKNFTTTNTRTATFTINPPAPTISPDPDDGPFNIGQQVTMTVPEALENATIKYVLGNDLTVAATTYTEPFALNENTTVNAWVEVTDEEEVYRSETVTANYTLKQDPKLKVINIWQRVRMGETFSQEVQSEVMTTTPTVTWSSSNEAVAIVDATTGVVTPVAPSSTDIEITATFAGDDTYSSATVSYAVSVQKGTQYLFVKDGDNFVSKVRVTKGNSLNINETYQVICPAEIAGSLTWTPDDETIVSAEDGVISAVGCGNTRIVVAFAGNSNYEADTYEFYVNAAPLAPTIGLAAGSYLSTHDPITITKEDIANTTISYTWDDITGNNDATWKNYTDDGVVFREGTLSARVGYIPEGGGDIVFSDTVSVAYTELIDIATCTVTGNENQTYNGSAYTPALTVTPAGGGTALTLDTDYTVSYKKGDAAVESMIDAATYTIVITAKDGSAYGGSKEVDFTIDQLDITDATVTLSNTELTFIPGDNGQGVEQSVTVSKITSGSMQIAGGGLNSYFDITGNTQTAVGTYTVTVTAKTDVANNYKGSATATFTIVNRTVTAADMGIAEDQTYGTYYSETEDLTLPEGLVAYVITGVSGTTVTTKRISNIPKGVAVLVEKGTSTESAAEATGNLLHGTTVDTDVRSIEGGSVYVLYQGEFVKTTSGTIPANRCYLLLSDTATGARRLTISHGDNTGIDNVMLDENGDERWYDLQGRRIEAPTKKGLYIRNGKTVVINKK